MKRAVLIEFARWDVQDCEADENALTIPYVYGLYASEQLMERMRKRVKALLWDPRGCTVFVSVALEWITTLKHLCGE
nr:hypothetical protein [Tanacetum cinerariifolium]